MKTLQKVTLATALITLFSSCQSNTDIKQVLSKSDTRNEIMDTIANNSSMSKEMMEAMMNSKNGKMMMQGNEKMMGMMIENQGTMIKMMKENPAMIQSMMSDMMEACKSDTSMMSSMCKTMLGNKQMMGMMQKIMGENKDMNKMNGMNNQAFNPDTAKLKAGETFYQCKMHPEVLSEKPGNCPKCGMELSKMKRH